jgi:hypothetical protein
MKSTTLPTRVRDRLSRFLPFWKPAIYNVQSPFHGNKYAVGSFNYAGLRDKLFRFLPFWKPGI